MRSFKIIGYESIMFIHVYDKINNIKELIPSVHLEDVLQQNNSFTNQISYAHGMYST